jgi:hypothetical protein
MTASIAPLFNGSAWKAQRIVRKIESKAERRLGRDSSTHTLIRRYRKLRETPS